MEKDNTYSNEQLKKDMIELKIESRLQTLAFVALFLFGVATLNDIVKKVK